MKKKNRHYRILALFLVMALALFLTPAAFAADDLDDLGPLIPSDLDPDHPDNLPPLIPSDFDDLPPLIPKIPPGKEPPTRPPIEIEVPDDGEDLDLKLSEDDIKKIIEGSAWTISINDTWIGTLEEAPDFQETILLSFVADKPGGEDMFGTYKARAAIIRKGDFIGESAETQSALQESDSFTIELTAHKAAPVDEDDDLGPLISPVAEFIGEMPLTITVLADPYNAMTGDNGRSFNSGIKIFVSDNGSVRMFLYRDVHANGIPMFLGKLSRSIDGRELS